MHPRAGDTQTQGNMGFGLLPKVNRNTFNAMEISDTSESLRHRLRTSQLAICGLLLLLILPFGIYPLQDDMPVAVALVGALNLLLIYGAFRILMSDEGDNTERTVTILDDPILSSNGNTLTVRMEDVWSNDRDTSIHNLEEAVVFGQDEGRDTENQHRQLSNRYVGPGRTERNANLIRSSGSRHLGQDLGVTSDAKGQWKHSLWGKEEQTLDDLGIPNKCCDSAIQAGEGIHRVNSASDLDGERPIESSSSADKERLCCSICLCDYETGDEVIRLPCRHIFHGLCINSWTNEHTSCPLCNIDLMEGF